VSLRIFHLVFILFVIVSAELFAAREFWYYQATGDVVTLWMGILALVGGLGVTVYAFFFVRKMDSSGIS
jgi:hypothetical protein